MMHPQPKSLGRSTKKGSFVVVAVVVIVAVVVVVVVVLFVVVVIFLSRLPHPLLLKV